MQIAIYEIGEMENDNPAHLADGESFAECCAWLYKQLADEYAEAESPMPAHISEANIIEFFANSEFEILIKQ